MKNMHDSVRLRYHFLRKDLQVAKSIADMHLYTSSLPGASFFLDPLKD
jgi:hypothetical protein